MTTLEYLAVSLLVLLTLLLVLFVMGAKCRALVAILLNSSIALLVYYILIFTHTIEPNRITSLGIGALGTLYLIAMLFM